MFPQVWKGYLQRKHTQQDRQTEMEFIGMVSPSLATGRGPGLPVYGTFFCVPAPEHSPVQPALPTPPTTQDCGGHDGGEQANARGPDGSSGLG